ncbi:hypothetical protein [Streptomyces xylophagus]|uniref:hypothetical protein n=1 Tax=Streptomyces xylophagus TaxID=285514 RepID=UPI0005BE2409|nr:hypothetical protein [Streptomyces xylophagus]
MLTLLWDLVGGEPLTPGMQNIARDVASIQQRATELSQLLTTAEALRHAGLVRASERNVSHGTPDEWRNLLASASREVALSGVAQHNWVKDREYFQDSVIAGAARGCHYRIMLYAPVTGSGNSLLELVQSEPHKGGSTSAHNMESLWFFHNVAEEVTRAGHPDAFQVRVLDGVIQYVMVSLFDQTVIATPYLYHAPAESCPALEIKGDSRPLFKVYAKEFDVLWDEARPLANDEIALIAPPARTPSRNGLHP